MVKSGTPKGYPAPQVTNHSTRRNSLPVTYVPTVPNIDMVVILQKLAVRPTSNKDNRYTMYQLAEHEVNSNI